MENAATTTVTTTPELAIEIIKQSLKPVPQGEAEEVRKALQPFIGPMVEICPVSDIIDALVAEIEAREHLVSGIALTALKLASDCSLYM